MVLELIPCYYLGTATTDVDEDRFFLCAMCTPLEMPRYMRRASSFPDITFTSKPVFLSSSRNTTLFFASLVADVATATISILLTPLYNKFSPDNTFE